MDVSSVVGLLGFMGALLGGYAYIPQIHHLITEKCSAGISTTAFKIWTLSSALILLNALYISSAVFILLGTIQFSASVIILIFSTRNKGHVCESHLHVEDMQGKHIT